MAETVTGSNNIDFINGTTNSKITGTTNNINIEGLSSGTAILSGLSDPRTIAIDASSVNDVTNKITIDKKTWKDAVKGATTVSGTFSTAFVNGQTIDGGSVALVTGDRILIKDQGSVDNGIYIVNSSGSPTRTSDAQSGMNASGSGVIVLQGTTNGSTYWFCDTGYISNVPARFNNDSLTFDKLVGATVGPAGSDTQFQYNNSGSFGATSDLTMTLGAPNIIAISEGSATSVVNIATDASHTGAVNIMTGASATGILHLGSATGTSVVQLRGSDVSTGIYLLKNSTQTFTGGVEATMTFNGGGDSTPWSNGNISESNGVITVGEAGIYRISYQVRAIAPNTDWMQGGVQINSESRRFLKSKRVPGGNGDGIAPSVSIGYLSLSVNDDVNFKFIRSPGGGICDSGNGPIGQFSVIKLLGT